MTAAIVPVRIWKEVRALAPIWILVVAVMLAATLLDQDMREMARFAYAAGALSLGALSIGHEYASGTLAALLAQPTRRATLLLSKAGVLALLLLALSGLAQMSVLELSALAPSSRALSETARNLWLWLPLLCGFFIAPALTLASRSALGGMVFAIAVTGAVWFASLLARPSSYGANGVSATHLPLFWSVMIVAAAIAGGATWWLFTRLQAVDGRSLSLPAWLAKRRDDAERAARANRGKWWLLLGKELRLQQLTFAISGLCLLGWLAVALGQHFWPEQLLLYGWVFALTLMHSAAIPLVAGSVASAEERQLGTVGWQTLLPVAALTQWSIKTAIVLAIAVVLAVGFPILAHFLFAALGDTTQVWPRVQLGSVTYSAVIAILGLYVSSLSPNTLRALFGTIAAVVALMWLGDAFTQYIYIFPKRVFVTLPFLGTLAPSRSAWDAAMLLLGGSTLAALCWLGMTNHRSAEHSGRRMLRQVGGLAALIAAAYIAVAAVELSRRFPN